MSLLLLTIVTAGKVKIATPFGLQHEECIVEVSNGAMVAHNDTHLLVTTHSGTWSKRPSLVCGNKPLSTTFSDPSCNSPPCTCNSLPCNNWIDNAGSMNLKAIIGGMSATYLTPSSPINKSSGQTLFFFIGAENTNGTPRSGQPPPSGRAILQPVLTFDPAGWCKNSSTGWCFSSWYCCPKNLVTHSPYIQNVEPGDEFLGYFNISLDGTTFETVGENVNTGEKTALKSLRQGRNFNWADITQEVYNIKNCDNFASSLMEFQDVQLWDTKYNQMNPNWLYTRQKPCGGTIIKKDLKNNRSTFAIMHRDSFFKPLGNPPSNGHWIPYEQLTDEFNNNQLDTTKWSTNESIIGWYGRKPGLFSNNNVKVSNGSLKLFAKSAKRNKSWPKGYDNYTTSAIHSINKISKGYFEIRAKSGNSSISSSFWLHQNNGKSWTEIDVYESTGSNVTVNGMNSSVMCSHTHIFKLDGISTEQLPNECGCTFKQLDYIHSSGSSNSPPCSIGSCRLLPDNKTFTNQFHVYGLLWNTTNIIFYFNGIEMSNMNVFTALSRQISAQNESKLITI